MNLNTCRKVTFDLETTGVNIATDKIVQAAFKIVEMDGQVFDANFLFNPGIPIPEEVSKIIGITDADVADRTKFSKEWGEHILDIIDKPETVIIGYNHLAFDIPLLNEELERVGLCLPTDMLILDAGNIFKKKEERTLTAAVKFYLGREMEGAHDAMNDVNATYDVFQAQLKRYTDLGVDPKAIAEFCRFNNNADFAGKLMYNDKNEICYAFGKHKGVRVVDEPGFGQWMLDKDFTNNTKSIIRNLIY